MAFGGAQAGGAGGDLAARIAAPQERLAPTLFERLIDEAPERKAPEPRQLRVLGNSGSREAVLRDLRWLFNSVRPGGELESPGYEYARRSVLNFGLPALAGGLASTLAPADLERVIRQAILDFEPRIAPDGLQVTALPALDRHNMVGLRISGVVWAQPVPLELLLHTEIDLETGVVAVRDLGE